MVPTAFTTGTWLTTLLRRWVRRGYAPNISLAEDGATFSVESDAGEQSIALIRADDGRTFVLNRFASGRRQ